MTDEATRPTGWHLVDGAMRYWDGAAWIDSHGERVDGGASGAQQPAPGPKAPAPGDAMRNVAVIEFLLGTVLLLLPKFAGEAQWVFAVLLVATGALFFSVWFVVRHLYVLLGRSADSESRDLRG